MLRLTATDSSLTPQNHVSYIVQFCTGFLGVAGPSLLEVHSTL